MTLTLKDLASFELMDQLENTVPIEKEKSIIDNVVGVKKEFSITESLLTLSTKLRKSGFVVQADNLDDKIFGYKKAEQDASSLYRAHSETGNDLLEFAHPEGDVDVADAQNEYGQVESPITQHEKIVEVATKTAQTAQKQIQHQDLNKQFSAIKQVISTNYLNSPKTQEEINDPKYQEFLNLASDVYHLFESLEQDFNSPGSSTEPTVMVVINDALKTAKFHWQNDLPSLVEFWKAVKLIFNQLENMKPVAKKAIIDMLGKALGIKTAQKKNLGFEEFKSLCNEIYKTLKPVLETLRNEKYSQVNLSNGKKVIEYIYDRDITGKGYSLDSLLDTLQNTGFNNTIGLYNKYIETGDVSYKNKAIGVIEPILETFKKLSLNIIESVNKGLITAQPDPNKVGFKNVAYGSQLHQLVDNLLHRWFAFWEQFGGGQGKDSEAYKYHSNFLTPAQISFIIKPYQNKFNSLKDFIQDRFINSPSAKTDPKVVNYINKIFKGISDLNNKLNEVINKAETFGNIEENPSDINKITQQMSFNYIKSLFNEPEYSSLANVESIDQFANNLQITLINVMKNLDLLINNNSSLSQIKDQLKSALDSRRDVILGRQ